MLQSRLHVATDEKTAKILRGILEAAFEDEGLPVAAFEDLKCPGQWEVSVYAETAKTEEVHAKITALATQNDIEIEFRREDIPDIDWVSKTQSGLRPVRAGRIIVHGTHDRSVPKPNDISVCLDAGMAFGTGHHGTTAGCLLALDRQTRRRSFRQILDLGTGSGVLAIAAAKLHNATIVASDNDPVAVSTARWNIKENSVASKIRCVVSDGFQNGTIRANAPYDLILANILAGPLRRMARDLARHLAARGMVILSGLLPHQKAAIVATYRSQGLVL